MQAPSRHKLACFLAVRYTTAGHVGYEKGIGWVFSFVSSLWGGTRLVIVNVDVACQDFALEFIHVLIPQLSCLSIQR